MKPVKETKMKTPNKFYQTMVPTGVMFAFALLAAMVIAVRAGEFALSDLTNRAVASNPRALEQFPWLARQGSPRNESTPRSENALWVIKKSSALAASPRMREQFPELTRTWQPSIVDSSKSGNGETQLATVMKNRALANSPRMKEQFPELARGYTPLGGEEPIQIAPLK